MTTKLLIDRELLERLADKNAFLHHTRKAQDELRAAIDSAPCDPRCAETCVRASMCATCMNALAAPVQEGYVLVPVEPTPEMVSAAEEAHMPFGDMDIALRMAILSAPSAPATVQGVNAQLLEAATESLDEIQAVMQEAYNSATPVCCGRAQNECCGSPDPEWNEHDQRTMDRFAPIERALRAAIAAARQEGWKV